MSRLALFDLDNTLLTGDSEVLWVQYLLKQGLLDEGLAARNDDMDRRYHAGEATAQEFCAFYAATFAGRTAQQWAPILDAFASSVIFPRLPQAAHALVQHHRNAGDLLVLTTASSRFLSQPSARALGFENLIATELESAGDGTFTGRTAGTLNMREGKIARLKSWLLERGDTPDAMDVTLSNAIFYSDSINDLPLLMAVGEPVAVDPDSRLAAEAEARRWPVVRLPRN
ncbi:MAG: HAD-IB family hydrolase [Comamonadaceae bacterium]|nr:MAG: HAD-IB family hydrolase [Comamonadaceae bacterium]